MDWAGWQQGGNFPKVSSFPPVLLLCFNILILLVTTSMRHEPISPACKESRTYGHKFLWQR